MSASRSPTTALALSSASHSRRPSSSSTTTATRRERRRDSCRSARAGQGGRRRLPDGSDTRYRSERRLAREVDVLRVQPEDPCAIASSEEVAVARDEPEKL